MIKKALFLAVKKFLILEKHNAKVYPVLSSGGKK